MTVSSANVPSVVVVESGMSHVNKTYNVGPVEIVVENKVVEEIV
jgi:hypothetical protein